MSELTKKLKKIIYICYFNILLSIFLGIVFSYAIFLIFPKYINIFLSIIAFLIITVLLLFLDYKIGLIFIKKENSKHKDYIYMKFNTITKENLIIDLNLESINNKIYVYLFKKRMLNTISFYFLENNNIDEIKSLKKKSDNYIKNNYPIAKCKDITKPHWLIKGQVLVANICDFKKIESYLNQGKNQLYEIGLIKCFLAIDKGLIIIPFYKCYDLNIIAFNRYEKMTKQLIKIFTPHSIYEDDA